MLEFTGKKLLYLGGISRARFVVERARKLGAYVIVADYNEDSPAKAVADEGVLINAMDVDALTAFGRERKIDGVMTGYADILLPVCQKVSSNLGLPCYMTDGMIRAATDKGYFNELACKYSVPVPAEYAIDKNDIEGSARKLNYPVFVKPLDSSGSRGADACYACSEFKEKFDAARSFSKTDNVVVEECLHGTEFILDYAIVNGEARLMSMADRYSIEGRPAAVNSCNLMIMPSKYTDRYYKEVDPYVRKMIEGEGYKNGLIFLQGYSNPQKIAFYEIGCRLGGTWPYIVEHFSKINPMDMLFRHAMTEEMLGDADRFDGLTARFKGFAAVIYFVSSQRSGQIGKVVGVDAVKKISYVVHDMQYYYEGDKFDLGRQTDIRFYAVHLVADTFAQLKENVNHIYSLVDFQDSTGKSLLMSNYDVDKLEGYGD